jgi:NACalpha-BTF3-like transcription factor
MTDGNLTIGLDELKEIIAITFRSKEAVARFRKPRVILSGTEVREALLKPNIDLFSCLLVQNGDLF